MEKDSYAHGVPSWVDVSTPDPAAASRFYSELFGWDVQEGPPESGGYAIAHLRGRTVAGLAPQQDPGPPAWGTYVNVDDAEAIAEAVAANGGKVLMPPIEVTGAGRMAILADPAGAVFGVWQPGSHRGAGLVNEPNTYCWSELVTSDVAGAKAFYRTVFGWGARTYGPEGPGGYSEFDLGGQTIAGMMEPTAEGIPPHWAVYFAVADTDAAVARIHELGGSIVVEPRDIEPGRFAVAVDPQGAMFSVLALKEEIAS